MFPDPALVDHGPEPTGMGRRFVVLSLGVHEVGIHEDGFFPARGPPVEFEQVLEAGCRGVGIAFAHVRACFGQHTRRLGLLPPVRAADEDHRQHRNQQRPRGDQHQANVMLGEVHDFARVLH